MRERDGERVPLLLCAASFAAVSIKGSSSFFFSGSFSVVVGGYNPLLLCAHARVTVSRARRVRRAVWGGRQPLGTATRDSVSK